MSENPYQSPIFEPPSAGGTNQRSRDELRKLAIYQKAVMVCILVYFGAAFSQIALQFALPNELMVVVVVIVLVDMVAGAACYKGPFPECRMKPARHSPVRTLPVPIAWSLAGGLPPSLQLRERLLSGVSMVPRHSNVER